ncbi:MAG: hypothetical protein QXW97_03750 [Candidatus Pacearchaeota archaeon]
MKIINKKNKIFLFSMIFVIFLIGFVIPQEQTWPAYNVCCEKTKNGAWCQNTLLENCDLSNDPRTRSPFRYTPTSCDSTSFCKPGCCIDTDEGLCMEKTPQKVCEESSGTWVDDPNCNVQQCALGCCILGDQASYVTLTRCKKLSSFYGLETDFKRNVKDEMNCILLAHLQDKGACVYEVENVRTCKFQTRNECLGKNRTKSENMTSQPVFYKDYLCSADELATNCGPSTKTTCIEGKDEVYFMDTCGNPANIYDSSKTYDKSPSYWQKIVPKAQSCGFNSPNGNAGSKSCGNCEYFKGSICSKGVANYGENICKDLNCYSTKNGKNYKNGESWCVDQEVVGQGRDVVGSRHFRHICINGEEIIEPCGDFRTEICIENEIKTIDGKFIEAACRPNRWKDCIDQKEKDDCLNTDKRDCFWLLGATYIGSRGSSDVKTITEQITTSGGGIKIIGDKGICLPNFPAGLKHWESGEAQSICSIGSVKEEITYEKNIFGSKKCVGNCEPTTDAWARKMNNICTSLGDCGAYINLVRRFTSKGVEWKIEGEKKVINGLLDSIRAKSK